MKKIQNENFCVCFVSCFANDLCSNETSSFGNAISKLSSNVKARKSEREGEEKSYYQDISNFSILSMYKQKRENSILIERENSTTFSFSFSSFSELKYKHLLLHSRTHDSLRWEKGPTKFLAPQWKLEMISGTFITSDFCVFEDSHSELSGRFGRATA